MKIIQVTKENFSELNSILSGQKIIHIGVEHLHSTPITARFLSDMFQVQINNDPYLLNECDILEHENLGIIFSQGIIPNLSDDYTFITIGYDEASS